MDYKNKYNEALERAREWYAANTNEGYRGIFEEIFPELKDDELTWLKNYISEEAYYLSMDIRDNEDRIKLQKLQKSLAWLEKQGQTFTKKDVDDAWLKGMCDAKHELENQCEQKPVEWGEEDENEYNHILKILNLVAEEQETKGYNNLISSANWLKSIKDRIQSKPRKKKSEQNLAKKYDITGIGSKHAEGKLGEMIKKKIETENVDNTNKVEPKFHEGEWVVSPMGVYWHIDKISNNRYEVTSNTGASTDWPLNTKLYHRFTIQDAKPGDIIYAESKFNTFDFIGIFYTLENGNFWCYCDVSSDSDIYNDYLEYWEFDNDKGFVALDRYNFYPATKEQRDCLFEKMKEAGYEWDAEKKELKHYKKS